MELREQLRQGGAMVDSRNFKAAEESGAALAYSHEEAMAAESRLHTREERNIAGCEGACLTCVLNGCCS